MNNILNLMWLLVLRTLGPPLQGRSEWVAPLVAHKMHKQCNLDSKLVQRCEIGNSRPLPFLLLSAGQVTSTPLVGNGRHVEQGRVRTKRNLRRLFCS